MNKFTEFTLPEAVRKLFELNEYEVQPAKTVHGAEIDMVAKKKGDPFSPNIYIEITIEHVDNEKYSKDLTKLILLREKDPSGHCLIISSRGFSKPVIERAENTRISALTYDELFKKFEKFEIYVGNFTTDTLISQELNRLNEIYEEPVFEDTLGKDDATTYLQDWKTTKNLINGWLVITGEYGTGKTALTRVLQYRWLHEYRQNPELPLPFRIELRAFARQFDARGLLHHFLDHNNLSHISVDFVFSLIRSGRIVLILDGYDEMAQYLHSRERRACLEALAELSADGAKGILTSRPNYFTEAEELQVFEALYASLRHYKDDLNEQAKQLLSEEKKVDQLLKQFINRSERALKDLTPEQTESLINRILADDKQGREVVMNLLNRISRSVESGDTVSLSGKPVIISYLLEIVEELKSNSPESNDDQLTEWQIYELIVDNLMLRDFRRTPELSPRERRRFLQRIAIFLSKKDHVIVSENDFKDLISSVFKRELSRLPAGDRADQIEKYFADLRSSATITRSEHQNTIGWRFSHNSLREFLLAEHLVFQLSEGNLTSDNVSVTDAMKLFAGSKKSTEKRDLLAKLSQHWEMKTEKSGLGPLLSLFWDGFVQLYSDSEFPRVACIEAISGSPASIRSLQLSRFKFSSETEYGKFADFDGTYSSLFDVDFSNADLTNSRFNHSIMENVKFRECDLTNSSFTNSVLIDVDFAGAKLEGADFQAVDPLDIMIWVDDYIGDDESIVLEKEQALGYLKFNGAITMPISEYYFYQHHPKFEILEKIVDKLSQKAIHQRRGLEQRGAAQKDVSFARKFVEFLLAENLIVSPKNRKDLVEVTNTGGPVFSSYSNAKKLDKRFSEFLENND